jgi:hypothetical protein
MRLRWIAMTFVFIGSIAAVLSVCSDSAGPIDSIVGMSLRVSYGVLFGGGFWAMSFLLQRWMGQPARTFARIGPVNTLSAQPPAPPVPTFEVAQESGPARYRVHGFDRDTHFETIEFVYADSPSNAQLKVELKGVDVASVEAA